MTAQLHFAEQPFTLHLFLERAQSLIDVIIAYDNLYDGNHPFLKSRITLKVVSGLIVKVCEVLSLTIGFVKINMPSYINNPQ